MRYCLECFGICLHDLPQAAEAADQGVTDLNLARAADDGGQQLDQVASSGSVRRPVRGALPKRQVLKNPHLLSPPVVLAVGG
jgi:hypothetical protein